MSLDDYKTTAEVATELGITPSEVERERRLFGIDVAKKGACRWWDADQVKNLAHIRSHYYGGTCPDCEAPLPWPAPKPRKARKPKPVAEEPADE